MDCKIKKDLSLKCYGWKGFIPRNPNKYWVRKNFGSEKNLVLKKFWVRKHFGSRKIWVKIEIQKNFGSKKVLNIKNFLVQKNLGQKKF